MGAEAIDPPPEPPAEPRAEPPAEPPAEPLLRLVATPGAEWPPSLLQQLRARRPITLCDLEEAAAGDGPILLGYSAPATALARALGSEGAIDIATLLNDWQRHASWMLRLRRRGPGRVWLVATPHLGPTATEALLRLLAGSPPEDGARADGDGEEGRDDVAPTSEPVALPGVVAHYLGQRSDISQLFADLEGHAELLGREPELVPAAPVARGLVLAERLLEDWRADRDDRLRREEERGALAERIEALHEELACTRREMEEERARLQDSEEERELILLQLQQVQEELIRTFAETEQARQEIEQARQETDQARREAEQARQQLEQARQQVEASGQRLLTLERECRALFLGSRLLPGVDPSQIASILALMRRSLRV
jgi:hypothetical protein